MTATPSTTWQEVIPEGEDALMAGYARQFAEMQKAKNERYGKGRALHRKQQLGLTATLEVLPGLPAHARHGLFAVPGVYDAQVRLSNGGPDRQHDGMPDIRGFAIKVLGVQGPGAMGTVTHCQDFLLINHFSLPFGDMDEFVGIGMAAARSPAAVVRYLVGRHGLVGGVRRMTDLARCMGKRFTGFATENFGSVAPICCGPYLARVRLTAASAQVNPKARKAWAADMAQRLRQGALTQDLQLQFFTDEAHTPVDDITVEWPADVAPWVTVARLTLPQQDPDSAQGKALSEQIEAGRFDPWAALVQHRPVGVVMRARKVAYFLSQQGRGAA